MPKSLLDFEVLSRLLDLQGQLHEAADSYAMALDTAEMLRTRIVGDERDRASFATRRGPSTNG